VSRPLSLDPELNLRLFTAGVPASVRAAGTASGAALPLELGAWNVLVDGIGPDEHGALTALAHVAGIRAQWVFPWLRLGGTPEQLLDLTGALHRTPFARLASELRAALEAFEAQLYRPEPTLVMGVLNVTPDSFSDGGRWIAPERAVEHGLAMVADGADILDIGGESSRPGAEDVPEDEELRRVLPVIAALRSQTGALISVDTRNAAVARACLDAGADWVNDVTGMTHDPAIADVVAAHPSAKLVLMHSRVRPAEERYSTAYGDDAAPEYEDVVADTLRWLRRQADRAIERGVPPERLWIDPGFGFGKTFEQNVDLLRRLREYTSAGLPVLVGTSRKSTVGRLCGGLPPDDRLEGTAATVASAIAQGAAAVRVHDVKPLARIARVTDALR
jgi:dihydropteroate synthase